MPSSLVINIFIFVSFLRKPISCTDCSADMKEQGKTVRLVHNPAAGKEDNDDGDELSHLIKQHGYRCKAVLKKDAVKNMSAQTDLIAVAGGDGTIRLTILGLLEKKLRFKRPIAILPQGTANNIALSLGIPLDNKLAIDLWKHAQLKKFDVGMVLGLDKKTLHFIESIGFGVFPMLIEKMSNKKLIHATKEEEIKMAIEELRRIAEVFPAETLKLITRSNVIEEECIMVEVMNIARMGPRLALSPDSDPGDGQFEVIIVTNEHRQKLIDFIDEVLEGNNPIFPIKSIRTNRLVLKSKGKVMHIDDELTSYSGQNITISLLDSLIEFIVK